MSTTETTSLHVGGIDPGLATGGLVIVDAKAGDKVLDAISLVEKKGAVKAAKEKADEIAHDLGGWSDKEFLAACLRCDSWILSLSEALSSHEAAHGPIDVFALESFVDQRSRAREEQQRLVRNRWQTPLVIGEILAVLRERGATCANGRIVFQNAGVVIRQWSGEIARLEGRRDKQQDIVVEGDHLVTNDHCRKALVHALALSLRLRSKERHADHH